MLLPLSNLSGSKVEADDGEAGTVTDILFDDRFWTIRFIIVDTNPWYQISDKVLISPIALLNYDEEEGVLRVALTKELIKESPKVDEFEPVSRKFEKRYFDYFGYIYYWAGNEPWGQYSNPTALAQQQHLGAVNIEPDEQYDSAEENHLRSAEEMHHYDINALDSSKGYIKDLVWDTETWKLHHIIVDTREWLPGGKKVLLVPEQLGEISWETNTVECKLTHEEIEACPEYNPD